MNIVQFTLIFLIRVYQTLLSPVMMAVLGPSARCRFTPSCSQYAREAIRLHGAIMGGWLAVRRLGRCHPWGDCGEDPPPAGPLKFKLPSLPRRMGSVTVPVAPHGVSPRGVPRSDVPPLYVLAKSFRPEAKNGERDARAPQNHLGICHGS